MPAKNTNLPAKKEASQNATTFSCGVKPSAKEVYLVGDFNNWSRHADRMVKRQGRFHKTKRLAPGEYQYKFLVDGEWHTDPSAPNQIPNEFGTLNSVIRVREEARE
jgi:1,4-alpha-glucan branching enzyme